ncbi:helix-turn-helix domain-containing protein [Streptomyces sp. NPDC094049]|uniref:PucR family transcriptional regulator n=1 Tax=Streptomyces sp. NPDC094049 TaxID=3154987 RepID=UPI0033201882
MFVRDLLHLENLSVVLVRGAPELLDREITTVALVDPSDAMTCLTPGTLVLMTGPDGQSDAVVPSHDDLAAALRGAGAAALVTEETWTGQETLADACDRHGVALLAVSARTSLRAAVDRVHLRLWAELRARTAEPAVPLGVLRELGSLLNGEAELPAVLEQAAALLELPPCSVLSPTGRVVAATPGGPVSGVGLAMPVGARGDSPFDGWWLVTAATPVSPNAVQTLANLLAPLVDWDRARSAAQREAARQLLAGAALEGQAEFESALAACGFPAKVLLAVVAAQVDAAPATWSADALTETLLCLGRPFAAGTDSQGRALAVVALDPQTLARELEACLPRSRSVLAGHQRLRFGVAACPVRTEEEFGTATVRARYALETADSVGITTEHGTLEALLRSVPVEVASAYHARVLGPLTAHDRENGVSLVATLTIFLDLDCSWTRTARSLDIHVNTVHYRMRRIEELTGRNLSRLADRADLRAALLCTPSAR